MKNSKKSKSNNAYSLEKMIENTKQNIDEAEISMEFAAGPEERENLEEKNERREHSIEKMKKQKGFIVK